MWFAINVHVAWHNYVIWLIFFFVFMLWVHLYWNKTVCVCPCLRLFLHRLSLWIWRACLSSTLTLLHCGKAARSIWWEGNLLLWCWILEMSQSFLYLHCHGKDWLMSFCPPAAGLAGHLGVNVALKSGSGSCSVNRLCFAYCDLQNSDVRHLSPSAQSTAFSYFCHTVCVLLSVCACACVCVCVCACTCLCLHLFMILWNENKFLSNRVKSYLELDSLCPVLTASKG